VSFFEELKRRNVIRVGIAYVIVAWLILQFADVVLNNIEAPGWVFRVIMLVLGIGLPLALFFAWAFELTPEGLKKEKDVDRTQSIAPQTGRKLNNTILVLMALAIGYLLFDKFSEKGSEPFSQETTVQTAEAGDEKRDPTPVDAIAQAQAEAKPTISRQSIAVLPFANRSNREDDLFFTDGIHDDLLTQLAKIKGLKVISRTSVMEYRDTTKKIPEIAAELGVANILEGGIQRAGDRVRINAQLIDVTRDEHLWAETYDREMTIENLFDIQSNITRAIVAAVKLQLSDEEERSLASLPTDNLEAYEAFLRARASINRADYVAEKFLDALPWAEKAVELDPGFAEGWAILTEIHGQLYWIGHDPSEDRKARAAEALARTLESGAETASAHAAQALWHYRFDRDFRKALEQYDKALALRPGDTAWMVYKALSERRLGLWDEAIATFEQILSIDPANVWAVAQMSNTFRFMNDWDELDQRLDDWILRFPDSADIRSDRVWAYMNQGQLDQAVTMAEPALSGGGRARRDAVFVLMWKREFERVVGFLEESALDNPAENEWVLGLAYARLAQAETSRSHFLQAIEAIESRKSSSQRTEALRLARLGEVLAELGEYEPALAAVQQAAAMSPLEQDRLDGSIVERSLVFVLARAGRRDEAIERLGRSLDGPGGYSRTELRLDPAWDFFRDDEHFNTLIGPEGEK